MCRRREFRKVDRELVCRRASRALRHRSGFSTRVVGRDRETAHWLGTMDPTLGECHEL